jgi:hypothetical protein
MGLNFSTLVYLPAHNFYARPIVITPRASQPGQPAYTNRGIYHSGPVDVTLEDSSILSDQVTTLDLRKVEYAIPPKQNDLINIPADGDVPAEGDFQVLDVDDNSGGELTLSLRRYEP